MVAMSLTVALLVLACFVYLERTDRAHVTVGIIVAALVVEAYLYPSQNEIPLGLFRLTLLGQSFRLPELLIGVGTIVRLVIGRPPRKILPLGVAWAVFLAWYGFGLVLGQLNGLDLNTGLFQVRPVIYLGGGLILAATVPVERYLRPRMLWGSLLALAVVCLASVPTTILNDLAAQEEGSLVVPPRGWPPLLPQAQLGILGADLVTIVVSLAAGLAILTAVGRLRPRLPAALLSLGLLLLPFVAGQRAAIAGALVVLSLVFLALVWGAMSGRFVLAGPGLSVLVMVVAVAALAISPVLASTSERADSPNEGLGVSETLSQIFVETGQVQSAQTRFRMYDDGMERVRDNPVVGSGLGVRYRIVPATGRGLLTGGGFHNSLLDIAVRSGLVGLVLFVIAVAYTVVGGLRVWRRHPDGAVAALAMAALVAVAGLLAKGMAESLFEKYRLAVLLGLLLGVCGSACLDLARRGEAGSTNRSSGARVLEPSPRERFSSSLRDSGS